MAVGMHVRTEHSTCACGAAIFRLVGGCAGWAAVQDGLSRCPASPDGQHHAPSAMPTAFNADGSAVCAHRDLSVCPTCATHPFYVDVVGAHYWVPEAADRAELLALVASR